MKERERERVEKIPRVSIEVDRCDRIYRQGDKVKGKIIFDLEKSLSHGGVVVSAWGTVKLSVRFLKSLSLSLKLKIQKLRQYEQNYTQTHTKYLSVSRDSLTLSLSRCDSSTIDRFTFL